MPLSSMPPSPIDRRKALGLIGGAASALVLAACGGGSSLGDEAAESDSSGSSGSASCSEIPDETGGPFPADGSQSGVVNVLEQSGIVRSNIVADIDGDNAQPGIALTLTIALEDLGANCAALQGAAVYIWHCNADGEYSVYSSTQNGGNHDGTTYLRGVQLSDSNGQVTFTTIYPGRYSGRATHIHIEVYADDSFATLLKTSQFAFDESINDTVYTSSTYSDSESTRETPNDEDGVFSDGYDDELLTVTGSNSAGYAAGITIGVTAS